MSRLSADELDRMRAIATRGRLGEWSKHPPSDYADDDPVLEILASELHELQEALIRAVDELQNLYATPGN